MIPWGSNISCRGNSAIWNRNKERADTNMFAPGCRKSPGTFPTAWGNAITFPPLCGGKVLAALAERLAMQGIQGIRSHSRRAAAPSSSPANTRADSSEQRFFDKLRADTIASAPGFRKSLGTFPTACKNAITFPPLCGGKVLATLAERLAMQGIQRIRSHSRRVAAPSSSPTNTRADSSEQRFSTSWDGHSCVRPSLSKIGE